MILIEPCFEVGEGWGGHQTEGDIWDLVLAALDPFPKKPFSAARGYITAYITVRLTKLALSSLPCAHAHTVHATHWSAEHRGCSFMCVCVCVFLCHWQQREKSVGGATTTGSLEQSELLLVLPF